MADQSGMEPQLSILRTLRAAADELAQAQLAAENREREELAAAQADFEAEAAEANAMLSQAEAAHTQGRMSLTRVRLARLLKAADREVESESGDDPLSELARADALEQTLIVLQAHVVELRGLRIRRARKRGAILLGFALLVALLVFAVPRLRVEIPYRWGIAMLDRGRWGWAQGSFRSVIAVNPQYKDAPALLREAYYRPASEALDAGHCEEARPVLRALLELDPTYRDVSALLRESYWRPIRQAVSDDQPELAAQEIIQWRAFGPSDARISELLCEDAVVSQAVAEVYAALWAGGRIGEPLSYVDGPAAISSLAVFGEGRQVAAAQQDGGIVVIDVRTGLPSDRFDVRGRAAVGYSLEGTLYAAAAGDDEVVYSELGEAVKLSSRWEEASPLVDFLTYPADGLVAASDISGRIWFWRTQAGAGLSSMKGHRAGEVHLAFSSDGRRLASGGADRLVRVWDTETGAPVRIIAGQPVPITAIAVAPDQGVLATGGEDGIVRLLSVTIGAEVGSLLRGEADITALAWHPSGQLIALGAADGAIALWNPASADKPLSLSVDGDQAITHLVFSPEGGLLAAGDAAGQVRVWRAQPVEGQALAALTPTPSPTLTPTFTFTPSRTPPPTPSPTQAPPTRTRTPTPVPEALVITENLNVRRGPGTNYQAFDQMHRGDRLTVIGRNPACDWWLVRLPNGNTGWVSAELVRSTTARCDPPAAPVPTLPPTATRRPTPVPTKTPRPTPVPTKAPWALLTDSTRDFTESQGANGWSYLWEGYGGRNSFNWREMPRFDGSCWRTDSPEQDIRICYGGEVHPGWGSNIALLWKSSVNGQIRIATQFRKLDTNCGDGVELAVYQGTNRILPHQRISGNDSRGRSDSVDTQVASGDLIFIVVTIRGESTCDKSQVNAQILLRQ